ncbi:phospholipid-transporting ATPase ABCA1-like [Corythoichthys intestinalis]|uniref:phospholipid-transporting ATPase ABCA1-like n=1 Tax=Corythoichthys intestinalis TaxID=161448 RepID=UPI0025A56175|nr:phospholipid-transporting ATPase ABCA1-like [Corythoichthys intestinalis]
MGVSQQLGVLLWKNILYYRSHKVVIFLEVVFTLIISLLIFDAKRNHVHFKFSRTGSPPQTRLPSAGTLRGAYESHCCNEMCDFEKSLIFHFYKDTKKFLEANPEELKTLAFVVSNFPSFMQIQKPLEGFFLKKDPVDYLCKTFNEDNKVSQNYDPNSVSCDKVKDSLEEIDKGKKWSVGKLLYTPDSPVVRRVINKIFEDVQLFQSLKQKWSEMESIFEQNDEYRILKDTITILDQIAQCLQEKLEGCTNEDQLIRRAWELQSDEQFYAGVVFELPNSAADLLPSDVTYKIRMDSNIVPTATEMQRKLFWSSSRTGTPKSSHYITSGFVHLQHMVEMALIKTLTGKARNIGLYIKKMPYPCYGETNLFPNMSVLLPLVLVLLWMFNVAVTIKDLVYEKEARLKETMKMTGLKTGTLWLSWFITSLVFYLLSTVIIVMTLKLCNILPSSNWMVIFFFLISFACATIMLCFLMSTLFSKATRATACGAILYLCLYLAYLPFKSWQNIPSTSKFLASFVCHVAFGFGLDHILNCEEVGDGVQWSNLQSSDGDLYNFHTCIAMLYVDAFIYATAAWYIEAVFPGEYGVPQPWNFLFNINYWRGVPLNNNMPIPNVPKGHRKGCIEADSSNLVVTVNISNLVKIYEKGGKIAVNHLNLRFYEGQITSLLGQNGAGKTTTMSILIGLFPPTSGTVYIQGMDIRKNIDIIRRTLGFCPQHNVLFDYMTVQDHVWFYGRLRGMSEEEVKAGLNSWLKDVGLLHKRHERTTFLSGGMKRKLSVALAFIGGPKVVVLDEPTAGMDPHSRRGIWDMLLKYRKDRTIILATHYMDEAEILADRIAIISQGRLCCCGSPLFLKSKLGVGSTLTMVKEDRPGTCNGDTSAAMAALLSMLHRHFPRAKLMELSHEVAINIPQEDCEPRRMAVFLSELNQNLSTFGSISYGLSDSKLEDIFLRVAKDTEDDVEPAQQTGPPQRLQTGQRTGQRQIIEQQVTDMLSGTGRGVTLTGWRLTWQQMRALLMKRYLCVRRDLRGLFLQIVLPSMFVLIGLWVTSESSKDFNLELHPCIKSNDNTEDVKKFEDTLLDLPGFSTKCRGNSILSHDEEIKDKTTQLANKTDDPECQCEHLSDLKLFPDCLMEAARQSQIVPGIILENLTNYIVEDYLIKSYPHLIKKSLKTDMLTRDLRYGGFSIKAGLSNDPVQNNVIVWYNSKGLHSLVSFVNVVNNAFLRQNVPDSSITAYNHPLLLGESVIEPMDVSITALKEMIIQICVELALSVVPSTLVLFLIKEMVSKAKHLQLVSGVNPIIYWLANLFWDLINYAIPAMILVLTFLSFQYEEFTSVTNLPAFILLLLLYGSSTITLMYPFSFMFTVASQGCIVLNAVNLFIGIIISRLSKHDVVNLIFIYFPIYCLAIGMKDLTAIHNSIGKPTLYSFPSSVNPAKDPFDLEYVRTKLNIMAVESVIFFLFTILLEYKFFIRRGMQPCTKIPLVSEDKDEDVARERERVKSGGANSDILTMIDLTKIYRGNRKPAVNQLCLGIPHGECFGLLGVNGAGKTTTFRMLTGDTTVSFGDALLNNCSVVREMDKVHQMMGYCPQFDAIWSFLTGTEHLEMYARVRGVPEESVTKVAELALKKLGLSKFAKQKAEGYSGGNMRKLNSAIALIGAPPVMFLDEPTTGMDPLSKRFMWDNIRCLIKDGRSVVLTSHSMEECEALCDRIAIMVSGSFMCLGSVQHLKNRFGGGYTITIRLADRESDQDTSPVIILMKNIFPMVELKKQSHNVQQYELPAHAFSLAQVFDMLANNYEELGISDFSVSQTTLDQVFINFATEYTEDQTKKPKHKFWTQYCFKSARIKPDAPIPLQPSNSFHL